MHGRGRNEGWIERGRRFRGGRWAPHTSQSPVVLVPHSKLPGNIKCEKTDKSINNTYNLREDTHKKSFFCGRTTKRKGGGRTPLTTKQKTLVFSSKEKIDKKTTFFMCVFP